MMGECICQCSFYFSLWTGCFTKALPLFFQRGMVDLCWLNHVVLRLAMLELHGGLSYPGGNGYQTF